MTILGAGVTQPVPSPSDPSWQNVVADAEAGITNTVDLQIPASLETIPDSSYEAREASAIEGTPTFYMLDTSVSHIFTKMLKGSTICPGTRSVNENQNDI